MNYPEKDKISPHGGSCGMFHETKTMIKVLNVMHFVTLSARRKTFDSARIKKTSLDWCEVRQLLDREVSLTSLVTEKAAVEITEEG